MIENARSSGITAVNVTVNGGGVGHASFDATVRELGYWMRELAAQADVLMQVRSIADIRTAKDSSKLGLIFGFQDAVMLEGDVSRLNLFDDFGIRVIQLTYNLRNELGDGCLEPGNAGLSRFGQAVVERMNQLGMVVDLSHCGQRTTADAIAASAAPVAITHSGCNAVFQHPRNKRDDELRALAQKGGVIGIYMMPFLNGQGPARIEHFLQHVEHAVQVCGEDHVGVGSDNSITPTVADEAYRKLLMDFAVERKSRGIAAPREEEVLFVEELNTPRRMETLADQMLARGYTEARVEKIIGGNWFRLFGAVWR
jgi:membrane dipeptidase